MPLGSGRKNLRGGFVTESRPRTRGQGARRPKIAVPTRTRVEPSAIAASRSSLMPIDKVVKRQALRLQRIQQFTQHPVRCALRLKRLRRGRNGHQPAQAHPLGRQRRHRGGQRRQLLRRDAAFARLAADVDLQAQLQRRQMRRPLIGQALRDAAAGRPCAPSRKASATARVLLLCKGPIRCHSRPRAARAAILSRPSCT